ncbi:hypothetical protein KIPB_016758, partial [Kipferlia bialata]
ERNRTPLSEENRRNLLFQKINRERAKERKKTAWKRFWKGGLKFGFGLLMCVVVALGVAVLYAVFSKSSQRPESPLGYVLLSN